MNCNWCHSPILEDARNINDEFSVHYWCIDFVESRLQVLQDRALWRNLIQFVLSTTAANFRRIRPQFIRHSQNA
jgi:hypothetical protein